MNRKKILIGTVSIVVGLPVALGVLLVLAFYGFFYVGGQEKLTLTSSGQVREYLLHVPESYDATRATPLVISMHAAALWPATQMEISRWNRVADEHGFIVVYPSGSTLDGTGTGLRPKFWLIAPEARLSANVRFISDLIDELESTYNIDPDRIYADGLSNGGAMAFALSCRLSDRIAAVGTVAAAQDQRPFEWCADSRPVPAILFHGTADPLVPYSGGREWVSPRPFPSVRDWAAHWARRNLCETAPREAAIAPGVTLHRYSRCANDADVALYTIEGGGHSWPGGKPLPRWLAGPTIQSVDATTEMWAFFREHPLRGSVDRPPNPSLQRTPPG